MAETDVFSALNVGSGLNTSELIKNLVDAERAPKEEKLNKKIETAEVSISAISELKNTIRDSNSVIKSLDGTEVFTGSSTSTSVSLKVTDPAKVSHRLCGEPAGQGVRGVRRAAVRRRRRGSRGLHRGLPPALV